MQSGRFPFINRDFMADRLSFGFTRIVTFEQEGILEIDVFDPSSEIEISTKLNSGEFEKFLVKKQTVIDESLDFTL